MRLFFYIVCVWFVSACSTTYQNQIPVGETFPSVTGESLAKQKVNIPSDFDSETTLLLLGFRHKSQFDIDRWLIGLDMTATNVDVYEIPTLQGLFPVMFSTFIDDGMRKGIPKELWKGVITVYEDGDKLQQFTGNVNPNNARVILIDRSGTVTFFHDQGFSVAALNNLKAQINQSKS